MAVGTDLGNTLQSGLSVAPQNYVADFNGSSVDFQDCLEHVTVIVAVGMLEGDTSVVVELEESDDDSTFTDISGASTTSTTTDHGVVVTTFGGRASRYVRAVLNLSGSSLDASVSVVLQAQKSSW